MATIDVRKDTGSITEIVFADENNYWTVATSLVREGGTVVGVQSDCKRNISYKIMNKEHALNMIKALNKAIELGWLVTLH